MKRIGDGIIKKTFAVSLVFVLIISILTITNFSIKDVLAEAAVNCGLCWVNPDSTTTIDPPSDWSDSESWNVVNLPGYPKTLIPTGSALEWEEFIIHYPGSHVSLADPQINPEVSISAASGVGSDCVTLNGSVTDMNQADWAAVYFTYGVGSAYDNNTDPELTSTTGSFSKQVCGLDPVETYSYRFIATNLNNNKSEFSSSASFTTDKDAQSAPSAPIVIDAGETYIILNTVPGCEYMRDGGGTWQDSTFFGGLDSETSYTFYQRYAETDTQSASPSSVGTSESTLAGFDCGTDTVIYDGVTYGTMFVGDQCWLDKNLNVGTMLASASTEPNTSDDVIEKWCYDNSSANCDAEGGLYNWNEAMRGSTTEGAQGICPDGWHIPTDTEWNSITTKEMFNVSIYPGYRHINGYYSSRDYIVYLWSSAESSSFAWHRNFYSYNSTVNRTTNLKGNGFSLRCIYTEKEEQSAPPAPTVASVNENEGIITLNEITNGEYKIAGGEWVNTPVFSGLDFDTTYTFYQRYAETATQLASPSSSPISEIIVFSCGATSIIYDGVSYDTFSLGDQCWLDKVLNTGTMLTSFAANPDHSDSVIEKWCPNDTLANCTSYGALYDWYEVMQGSTTEGAQGICPDGWHVPSYLEYDSAINAQYLNIDISDYFDYPGEHNSSEYRNVGDNLALWSSTLSSSTKAWKLYIYRDRSTIYRRYARSLSVYGYSVKCIKD
ncbi:MAG: hypothetical protein EOL97_08350 [Spirochaetia bacterium]|nr:hypothetical protein [Spirochaetia bacterium]